MIYYLFKVTDSANQEYYVLNNQWIGYIGFDSNSKRSRAEYDAGINPSGNRYVLWAKGYFATETDDEKYLHQLNCESKRFTFEEIQSLFEKIPKFNLVNDPTVYKIYHPNAHSSECWLRQIDWAGKKKFKEIK